MTLSDWLTVKAFRLLRNHTDTSPTRTTPEPPVLQGARDIETHRNIPGAGNPPMGSQDAVVTSRESNHEGQSSDRSIWQLIGIGALRLPPFRRGSHFFCALYCGNILPLELLVGTFRHIPNGTCKYVWCNQSRWLALIMRSQQRMLPRCNFG